MLQVGLIILIAVCILMFIANNPLVDWSRGKILARGGQAGIFSSGLN